MLTDAEMAAIRARRAKHAAVKGDYGPNLTWCAACGVPWPCGVSTDIDALLGEVERLRGLVTDAGVLMRAIADRDADDASA